jgi:hypothetical protein
MEVPYFPSPVWNSSFEDNDASTTLDTSVETENDSMTRYDIRDAHDHKLLPHTSRSSPGAPLGKELHSMLGYFDDVESFTSKAIQLKYDDVISPSTKAPPSSQHQNQGPNYFYQGMSPLERMIPSDGESNRGTTKATRGNHVRRSTGFELEVMQESDDATEAKMSSPATSVRC